MRLDLLVNDFTYRAYTDRFIVLFESHFKRNLHPRPRRGARVPARHRPLRRDEGRTYNVGLSDANLSKLRALPADPGSTCRRSSFIESNIGQDPDKRDYIVSNEKIERTGYRPAFSLDDGIRELIKGFAMIRNSRSTRTSDMRHPSAAAHLRRLLVPERGGEHPDADRAAGRDVRRAQAWTTSCSSSTTPRPTRRSSAAGRSASANPRVKIVNMSRRFGVAEGVLAGMAASSGDAIVYHGRRSAGSARSDPAADRASGARGADVVHTVRTRRHGENALKMLATRLAYRIIQLGSSIELPVDAGDFKLLSRAGGRPPARARASPIRTCAAWSSGSAFTQAFVPYERDARHAGRTHFPFFSRNPVEDVLHRPDVVLVHADLRVIGWRRRPVRDRRAGR